MSTVNPKLLVVDNNQHKAIIAAVHPNDRVIIQGSRVGATPDIEIVDMTTRPKTERDINWWRYSLKVGLG